MFGINSEADSLMKQLFEYAVRERDRGVYDFTEIISGFYRKLDLEYNDIPTRNSFTNRLLRIMKEYVEIDPRFQGRMDNYLSKSAAFDRITLRK